MDTDDQMSGATDVATASTALVPAAAADEVTAVQAAEQTSSFVTTINGQSVVVSKRQAPIRSVYDRYVSEFGKFIDDEKEDFRRFLMLQVARSSHAGPEFIDAIEKARSGADLDCIEQERRKATINCKEYLDEQAALEVPNLVDASAIDEELRKRFLELREKGILQPLTVPKKDGTGEESISLRAKTKEEKTALIAALSRGYQVYVGDESAADPGRDALARDAAAVRRLIVHGMPISGTEKPGENDEHKAALADHIAAATDVLYRYEQSMQKITYCDRRPGTLFKLSATAVADRWAPERFTTRRVDCALPIAPDVIMDRYDATAAETNRALVFTEVLDTLWYTPKLYLLITGMPTERVVSFSHLWRFYNAIFVHLLRTDLLPEKAAPLISDELRAKLEAAGAYAVINKKTPPLEVTEAFGREEIKTQDRNWRVHARVSFMAAVKKLEESFAKAKRDLDEYRAANPTAELPGRAPLDEQFLALFYDAVREYSLELIRYREMIIMLLYKNFIPRSERYDFMTVGDKPCACCTPQVAKDMLAKSRKGVALLRANIVQQAKGKTKKMFDFHAVDVGLSAERRVDAADAFSPTMREVTDFMQFLDVDFSANSEMTIAIANQVGDLIDSQMKESCASEKLRNTRTDKTQPTVTPS